MKKIFLMAIAALIFFGSNMASVNAAGANEANNGMMVRLAEIEVHPQYLAEYIAFAKDVGEISVAKEPGVIAIYSMQMQADGTQFRIMEIYRDEAAYKAHLATEHFKVYKQGTLHMVKSLKLIDMNQLSPKAFKAIFAKARKGKAACKSSNTQSR